MLTALTPGMDRRWQGPVAAVYRPDRLGRRGPVGTPPVEMSEMGPCCVASAVAGGPQWWSADLLQRKDGNSAVATNWPSRTSCERSTASARENSLSSLKVALTPNISQGR